MNTKQNHQVHFDTLKGLSAFCIVLFHLQSRYPDVLTSPIPKWGGVYGNVFFFMCSGFFMMEKYHRSGIAEECFESFIIKRIKKFYLCYLLSNAACLFYRIKDEIGEISFERFFYNITLTTTGWIVDIYPYNTPTWFLSQLVMMYIVWFIMIKCCEITKIHRHYFALALIAFGMAVIKMNLNIPFLFVHNGVALTAFFTGVIIYYVSVHASDKQIWSIICVLFAISCMYAFFGISDMALGMIGDGVLFFTLCFVPFLILLFYKSQIIKTVFGSYIFKMLFGGISIWLFFWHIPLLFWFMRLTDTTMFLNKMSQKGNMILYLSVLYASSIIYRIVAFITHNGINNHKYK